MLTFEERNIRHGDMVTNIETGEKGAFDSLVSRTKAIQNEWEEDMVTHRYRRAIVVNKHGVRTQHDPDYIRKGDLNETQREESMMEMKRALWA